MNLPALRAKGLEFKMDKDYRELAKKIIQLENKANKISKMFVERERRKLTPLRSTFTEKALSLVRQVPRGNVTTYGEIAKTLRKPKSSIAVGSALAKNVHYKTVPFHRVVKSDGSIWKGEGVLKRRAALKKERVKVEKGKVDLDKHMFHFVPEI